ncbi:hypothetical protein M2454_003107 [Aequitasia blattaphilus]
MAFIFENVPVQETSVEVPVANTPDTKPKEETEPVKEPEEEKPKQESLDFNTIPKDADETIVYPPEEEKSATPVAFQLPKSIPKNLRDLMEGGLVSEEEIQKVVAQRGYFPIDTPIQNYPEDFVNGVLVGAWKQVYKMIQDLRSTYNTPFNN